MYARAPLQAVGSGRSYLRLTVRQCQRQRLARHFSVGKDEPSNIKERTPNAQNSGLDAGQPRNAAQLIDDGASPAVTKQPGTQTPAQELDDDGFSDEGIEAYSQSRRQRAAAASQQIQSLQKQQKGLQDAPSSYTVSASGTSRGQTQVGHVQPMYALDGVSEEAIEKAREESSSLQEDLATLEQYDKEDITPVAFDPADVSRNEFLHSGRGGATISAANFEGVVQDRVKMLTEMRQDGTRWAPELAKKMMRGGLVSFNSEAEKEAVVAAARDYAHRQRRSASNVRKGLPDVIAQYEFAPLPERTQKSIVDRYVRGRHADPAAKPHKSPVLNEVRASLVRNNTYLARDGAVFLRKVEAMLAAGGRPAAAAAGKQAKSAKPALAKK